jgi:hypothetical protein
MTSNLVARLSGAFFSFFRIRFSTLISIEIQGAARAPLAIACDGGCVRQLTIFAICLTRR